MPDEKRVIQTPLEFLELQKECIARVREYVEIARKKLGVVMGVPQVLFSIQGTTAGRAYWPSNVIKFNPTLLFENPDTFVEQTAGHEVGHLVAHWLHEDKRIDPHGIEWKRVMGTFGLPANRCHNYDTSNVPTRMANVKRIQPVVQTSQGIVKQIQGAKITEFD